MSRPALPASFVRSAACFAAAAKVVATVWRRWRPDGVAALDDRMLRDIGLTRQDLSPSASEPQFRTMADVRMHAGPSRDRGSRHR